MPNASRHRSNRREADFGLKLRRHVRQLARLRFPSLPWYVDREDLVQEGVLHVLNALHRDRRRRKHRWAWVDAQAHFGMLMYLRAERRPGGGMPLEVATNIGNDGMADDVVAELVADNMLSLLDEDTAEICRLKMEGLHVTEIARAQGLHRNTIHGRIRRSRGRLCA